MEGVQNPGNPVVTVAEVPTEFGPDSPWLLVDVREQDEWESGHVAGALHVPLGDIPIRIDELDPDADLLIMCHSGGRSFRVLEYLQQRGIEAQVLRGGIQAWNEADRPLVTGA